MSKSVYAIVIIIMIAVCFNFSNSFAQDTGPRDLNDYTCKDCMRFSGENRSIALAFLHGYLLGKKGTTEFDTAKMSEATDQFIEYCLDNPTVKALDAMGKFIK